MPQQFSNAPTVNPTSAILATDTTINVTSFTGLPSVAPYRINISEGSKHEILEVTAGAGTLVWTVTRAVEANLGIQTAQSFSTNAIIDHILTAVSLATTITEGAQALITSGSIANDAAASRRQHLAPMGIVGQGSLDSSQYNSTLLTQQYIDGIRMRLIELPWNVLQPIVLGALDGPTVTAIQARIDAFVALGPDILLCVDLGLQYPLASTELVDPITDQYGQNWYTIRGTQSPCINVVWSSTVRGYVSDYIQRIFTAFNFHNKLWAIRTGMFVGEWAFPPNTNSAIVGTTTSITKSGTAITYTFTSPPNVVVNNYVSVAGASNSFFNINYNLVVSVSGNSFTTFTSDGSVQTAATTAVVTVWTPGSFWAYDSTAQASAAVPVDGGNLSGVAPPRPSKSGITVFANSTQALYFYYWYVDSITNAANWVHDQLRQYTNAWICPLTPGGGMWQALVTIAANNLLDERVLGQSVYGTGNWWERMYGSLTPPASAGAHMIPKFRSKAEGCMNWNSGLGDTSGNNNINTPIGNTTSITKTGNTITYNFAAPPKVSPGSFIVVTGSSVSAFNVTPGFVMSRVGNSFTVLSDSSVQSSATTAAVAVVTCEFSANQWDWTSAHAHSFLANANGRPLYGENPGGLFDSSPAGLIATNSLAERYGYLGWMFVRQSQMLNSGYATEAQFAAEMAKDRAL